MMFAAESIMLRSIPEPAAIFVHQGLEWLAYFIAARLYWKQTKAFPAPTTWSDRLLLLGAAVFGAFAGSRLLHMAEHWEALVAANDPSLWLGGKTVLGGFLGGTLGVEIAKKAIGWTSSTGDAWVAPLAAGLLIGRIGCQLSGPWDQTYGIPSALPWAWDYGDGAGRHPVSAYEMILAALIFRATRHRAILAHRGAAFALFLLLYSTARFALEFLKPPFGRGIDGTLPVSVVAGLTPIQWASLVGIVWFGILLAIRLADGKIDGVHHD